MNSSPEAQEILLVIDNDIAKSLDSQSTRTLPQDQKGAG